MERKNCAYYTFQEALAAENKCSCITVVEAIFSEIHIVLVNIIKARSYSKPYRYSVSAKEKNMELLTEQNLNKSQVINKRFMSSVINLQSCT